MGGGQFFKRDDGREVIFKKMSKAWQGNESLLLYFLSGLLNIKLGKVMVKMWVFDVKSGWEAGF